MVACGPEAVRDILRAAAARVPRERRAEVLDALPAAPVPGRRRTFDDTWDTTPDHALTQGADALVSRLEAGHYYAGLTWDDERQEERAAGDESWAMEMDELFGSAASAYLSGNVELAARVYGRLLGVFRHADATGIFCGPEPPDRMVQTDLNEAKRRYLRAIYAVSPDDLRPTRVLAELRALRRVGSPDVSLRSVSEMDGEPPLAGLEAFLPRWIDALTQAGAEPGALARETRRLLREAVEMARGPDGLGDLARSEGADHPEAYHDWVGALVRAGRTADAVRAARQGMGSIRDDVYRARMADRLAVLAELEGDAPLRLEAARAAWAARPTDVRLLLLVAAAEPEERMEGVIAHEAAAVLRPGWPHSDALACRVLLLAGRFEEAITRFRRADALGWGRPDHAGSIVLPFLLVAGMGATAPEEGSAVARLWETLDAEGRQYIDRRLLLDAEALEPLLARAAAPRPYSALLSSAIAGNPQPPAARTRLIEIARSAVESAVGELLECQHRRGHALAATATMAVAEVLAATRGEGAGVAWCDDQAQRWARWESYARDLQELRNASGRVPAPPRRPRSAPLLLLE